MLDALIIGGGQSGLGVAFGLMREKVNNILVIDENQTGYEGPWRTFARMPTLRTPKHLTGLDYGNPHLTFQAYFEAKYGAQAYEAMKFIATAEWADFLSWYREVLEIPVQNLTRATHINYNYSEKYFEIDYMRPNEEARLFAKTIVLATGIDGAGQWSCPEIITNNLPTEKYAHTREEIKFASLKNKRVGVLGAAASAFDNALMALEHGALEVQLFSRRDPLPSINPYRWAEFVGFLKHHGDLSDEVRWEFIIQFLKKGQLPPLATFERAKSFTNFYLQIGQSLEEVSIQDEHIKIKTNDHIFYFDYVIVGTGFVTNLKLRPELASLAEHIACWQDRFVPQRHLINEDLSRHPYLGPHFELQEKIPNTAPYLHKIFSYTFGGLPSLGLGGGNIWG